MHTLEHYKTALVHLGRGMTKCTRLKNELIKFLAVSEKHFRDFETHFGQLQDNLNKIEAIEPDEGVTWFQKRVLRNIRGCVNDLTAMKRVSEGVAGIDEADEKVIMWEEEGMASLLGEIEGQERRRLEAMIALLTELFGELKDLENVAKKTLVEAINTVLKEFGVLAGEIEQFTKEHKVEVYKGVREGVKQSNGRLVQEIIIAFKYAASGAKKVRKDFALELSAAKTIDELTIDGDILANKIGRELHRVILQSYHEAGMKSKKVA